MTSKKLSQHEQDFADAMALKLRLNREQREKEEERGRCCSLGAAERGAVGAERCARARRARQFAAAQLAAG